MYQLHILVKAVYFSAVDGDLQKKFRKKFSLDFVFRALRIKVSKASVVGDFIWRKKTSFRKKTGFTLKKNLQLKRKSLRFTETYFIEMINI